MGGGGGFNIATVLVIMYAYVHCSDCNPSDEMAVRVVSVCVRWSSRGSPRGGCWGCQWGKVQLTRGETRGS